MDTLIETTRKVAFNLGILADNGTTISSSRVTEWGIKMQINNDYRYTIAQPLMRKFPLDFEQPTIPFNSNTKQLVVDASSATTTLVSTSNDFNAGMVGFKIHNPTTSEKVEIDSFVSDTTVVLKSAPSTSWSGNTVYVLGNEFPFTGVEVSDLVSVNRIEFKESTRWKKLVYIDRDSESDLSNEVYRYATAGFYLTSLRVAGKMEKGFGIFPYPQSYNNLLRVWYTQLPTKLENDTDTFQDLTTGVSQMLEYSATSWGAGLLGNTDLRNEYKTRFTETYKLNVANYKPLAKASNKKSQNKNYYNSIMNGTI